LLIFSIVFGNVQLAYQRAKEICHAFAERAEAGGRQ